MDTRSIDLIRKFNNGEATPAEIQEIESLIEKGIVPLTSFDELAAIDEKVSSLQMPEPTSLTDDRFYAMLAREKRSETTPSFWKKFFAMPDLLPRVSFAAVALIIGVVAGYLLKPTPAKTMSSNDELIQRLNDQVSDMKEMMMLSLLEKESASDRLKAVSLTEGMDQASRKVTTALLQTLNQDSNVNVRLAALDALKPYAKDSHVREALIQSIAQQDSPLVQIALAELMVQLQEKSSVTELQKILKRNSTPKDVRKRIEESIHTLI